MAIAFHHPLLGPCEMLPMRRRVGMFWAYSFLAMAIGGPIVLALWLVDPSRVSPEYAVLALACALVGPFSAWGQFKGMRSPYFLVLGANGFATSVSGAIPWSNVEAIAPRLFRGKTVGLAVLLRTPRKPSLAERVTSIGQRGNWDPSRTVGLPKNLTYLPLDQLEALLTKYVEASRSRA
jgi:hypothetical protein